jgi:glycosyltransferase involved in cell wall biosynthesis
LSLESKFPATTLAVVVPVFNEAEVLQQFNQRCVAALESLDCDWQLIYADDGSSDGSAEIMDRLAKADQRIGVVRLSRNFGKEVVMTAGLDVVDADAAVIIDADLQDPPELIPELVARWREGADVVYAVRTSRAGEPWLKRATAAAFYRVINWISGTPIPRDTGDYRLLNRRALDALGQIRERHRFMKGLFAWVGYHQVPVPYERDARHAGDTKFNYWRLWNFALDGITSFTTAPLRFATWLGLASAGFALLYAAWVVAKTLLWGEVVKGYPSMMVVILFLGGVQLITLGIIGEYLGRLFGEAKGRPLYLIGHLNPPGSDQDHPTD